MSKRHDGDLTPVPVVSAPVLCHFLRRVKEQGARLEEPGSGPGGGAKRLTRGVVSHGLCQHGLPTARWAVHEDTSGRIDADLKGGERRMNQSYHQPETHLPCHLWFLTCL